MRVMPCPQCGVDLNIPEEGLGRLVMCSACRHRFVASEAESAPVAPPAEMPAAAMPPAPGPAQPPIGPYPFPPLHPPPAYPYGQPASSGHAVASLVLGIISIPTCLLYGIPSLICGILAVVFASTASREIAAGRAAPTSAGMASAGRICGWIGIGLSIGVGVILLVIILASALG